MKKFLSLIALFCVLNAQAQNYLITFAGTGASVTVNSVYVENLTAGTSLTLNGDQTLRLTSTTGINQTENNILSGMKIYPNPMTDYSVLQFYPPVRGDVTITVFDMSGKQLAQSRNWLENSPQEFRLSGIRNGLYIINAKGNSWQYSAKLMSNGRSNGMMKIEKSGSNIELTDIKGSNTDVKGDPVPGIVDMEYTTGDRLKFTGVWEDYSTVWIDIPAESKVITYNFVACTDGDDNNYPVVEIGTQTWMAENLKTTKYIDGITLIPNETDNTNWSVLTTPAYCWYDNNVDNKDIYGALYNWYTVNTGNLCPDGWHIPTDAEWTTLDTYLGGISVSGGKLKETGTTHWATPNIGATNESGFTALPAGYRLGYGQFGDIGKYNNCWSSTQSSSLNAWYRETNYGYGGDYRATQSKKYGYSVRCIKD